MESEKSTDLVLPIVYVSLGLLVVLTLAYLAFAAFGAACPEIGWLTGFLVTTLGGIMTDRYQQHQNDRKIAMMKAIHDSGPHAIYREIEDKEKP